MHYEILDDKRRAVLPLFKAFKPDFYLAGGTGLALQLGHRDSVDFDFFSEKTVDTVKLFDLAKTVFTGHRILKTQEEKNTLGILVDEDIKISFMSYRYPLVKDKSDAGHLCLASIEDIACMKLSAIVSRATNKDYIDLYYILQTIGLNDLLAMAKDKFPDIDQNLFLKSLVYYDDVIIEPIVFKNNEPVGFETVKHFLTQAVKRL